MIIICRATTAAPDSLIAAAVRDVLDRRAAMLYPPVSLAIPDAILPFARTSSSLPS